MEYFLLLLFGLMEYFTLHLSTQGFPIFSRKTRIFAATKHSHAHYTQIQNRRDRRARLRPRAHQAPRTPPPGAHVRRRHRPAADHRGRREKIGDRDCLGGLCAGDARRASAALRQGSNARAADSAAHTGTERDTGSEIEKIKRRKGEREKSRKNSMITRFCL